MAKEMETTTKSAEINDYSPSVDQGTVGSKWQDTVAELKHTFLTKDGWIGDYVRVFTTISDVNGLS